MEIKFRQLSRNQAIKVVFATASALTTLALLMTLDSIFPLRQVELVRYIPYIIAAIILSYPISTILIAQ